jgi:hypothetical protein
MAFGFPRGWWPNNEGEEIMYRKLILIATLIVLAVMSMQAQQHEAQSAASTVGWSPAPTAESTASTDKTFDQLMSDAMSVTLGNTGLLVSRVLSGNTSSTLVPTG